MFSNVNDEPQSNRYTYFTLLISKPSDQFFILNPKLQLGGFMSIIGIGLQYYTTQTYGSFFLSLGGAYRIPKDILFLMAAQYNLLVRS